MLVADTKYMTLIFVAYTRYMTICWCQIRDIGRFGGGKYEIYDVMLMVYTRYRTSC